jgi:hypothetical protein
MHIKQNPKSPTEKSLAKLILNSLIGRFGMDINKSSASIHSYERHMELMKTKPVKNTIKITEDLYLDVYDDIIDKNVCQNFNIDFVDILNKSKITEAKVNSSKGDPNCCCGFTL